MRKLAIAVMVGVISFAVSTVGYPQLAPFNAAAQIIDLQQQDGQQHQRIYPTARQFMGGRQQPIPSGAIDANGLLINPNYTGYVRPIVKTPMYQIPGQR